MLQIRKVVEDAKLMILLVIANLSKVREVKISFATRKNKRDTKTMLQYSDVVNTKMASNRNPI